MYHIISSTSYPVILCFVWTGKMVRHSHADIYYIVRVQQQHYFFWNYRYKIKKGGVGKYLLSSPPLRLFLLHCYPLLELLTLILLFTVTFMFKIVNNTHTNIRSNAVKFFIILSLTK